MKHDPAFAAAEDLSIEAPDAKLNGLHPHLHRSEWGVGGGEVTASSASFQYDDMACRRGRNGTRWGLERDVRVDRSDVAAEVFVVAVEAHRALGPLQAGPHVTRRSQFLRERDEVHVGELTCADIEQLVDPAKVVGLRRCRCRCPEQFGRPPELGIEAEACVVIHERSLPQANEVSE